MDTYAKRLFTNSSLLNVGVYGTRLPTRSAARAVGIGLKDQPRGTNSEPC
jgi:hypothetical protein